VRGDNGRISLGEESKIRVQSIGARVSGTTESLTEESLQSDLVISVERSPGLRDD